MSPSVAGPPGHVNVQCLMSARPYDPLLSHLPRFQCENLLRHPGTGFQRPRNNGVGAYGNELFLLNKSDWIVRPREFLIAHTPRANSHETIKISRPFQAFVVTSVMKQNRGPFGRNNPVQRRQAIGKIVVVDYFSGRLIDRHDAAPGVRRLRTQATAAYAKRRDSRKGQRRTVPRRSPLSPSDWKAATAPADIRRARNN